MASAISSFKQAFSNYRSRLLDYAIYSILACLAESLLCLVMLVVLIAFGALSIGSIDNFFSPGSSVGTGLLGIGTSIIIVFIGYLAGAWALSGVHGAYFSAVNAFISSRGHSVGKFFSDMLAYANRLFVLSIALFIIIGVPVLFLVWLSSFFETLPALALLALAAIYGCLLSFLMLLSVPAMVVDGKPLLQAMKTSVALSVRNFVSLIAFVIIAGLLALPMLLILLTPIYYPLFYMPVVSAALLLFYKGAR